MKALTVIAVLVGLVMLMRNLPRAIVAVLSPKDRGTNGIIAIINVLLAVAIIVSAALQSRFGAGFWR